MRTVSCYFTIFICDLQDLKLCDLFNTISCYKFLGDRSVALLTCVETCFVEESIDSLPTFNLGFCSVTFDF